MRELSRLATEFDAIIAAHTMGGEDGSFGGIAHETTISIGGISAVIAHPEATTDQPEYGAVTILVDMMNRAGEPIIDEQSLGDFLRDNQRSDAR